jgi:hypothetical protein
MLRLIIGANALYDGIVMAGITQTYWLGFADQKLPKGRQFPGVAIIEAIGYVEACLTAHRLGINPGGEVLGWLVDNDPPSEYRNRLLSADEATKLAHIIDGVDDED